LEFFKKIELYIVHDLSGRVRIHFQGVKMKICKDDLNKLQMRPEQVRKITYADGGVAYVFKKAGSGVQNTLTRRRSFPPVNRNEPMTKAAFRGTLNRYLERLVELDLEKEKCLFLTLTICNEKYNDYEKICDRFKVFTNKIRFNRKVGNFYVGAIRFIEVQQKGFFHIHCIVVFNVKNIALTWKDLRRMWGWGYVRVKAVSYLFGLYDYLTKTKHGTENDGKFTRYPKGARVIQISQNLPKGKGENITISSEECAALIQSDKFVGHLKIHKYFDTDTQRVRTVIDKMVLVQIIQKEVAQIK